MKIFILGILLTILSVSCTSSEKTDLNLDSELKVNKVVVTSKTLSLIESKCYSCHSPNSASHDDILAPPLAAIKRKYLNTYPTEQEFVAKMFSFLANPTEEKAIGPVKRFGLMPKQELTDKEAKDISGYIFKEELAYPAWLPQHWKEKHKGNF